MKSLNRIINKVFNETWLITPAQHKSMVRQLEMVLSGNHFAGSQALETMKAEVPTSLIPTIGIIPVFGIIGHHLSQLEMECGGCSLNEIQALAKKYMNDDSVTKVALYINSPGGQITGLLETYNILKELAAVKELTAYTDDICCSSALWLSSAASRKYTSPSALVGACGVYSIYLDESAALNLQGVRVNAIVGGKYKMIGASYKEMTEEERAILTADVQETHNAFKKVVLEGAPNLLEQDKSLEGLTYSGEKAVAINLFDSTFDTFEDFISFIQ